MTLVVPTKKIKPSSEQSKAPRQFQFTTNTLPFNWSMLSPEDFRLYIRNLRQVLCPEQTIRDIIIGAVNRMYGPRIAALKPLPNAKEYWKPKFRSMPPRDMEKEKQLAQIEEERRSLLRNLFGTDPEAENQKQTQSANVSQPLAFLSEEKQTAVKGIWNTFSQKEIDLQGEMAASGAGKYPQRLKALNDEKEKQLAQILSPDEMDQYLLRNSSTAQKLQWSLQGFNPTEKEFRNLFNLYRQFEQKGIDPHADDPLASEERQKFDAKIKSTLGDERYADYQRTQDSSFQALRFLTDRYDLGDDVAVSVYNLKKSAETQRQALLNNTTLASPDLDSALQQLREQTKRSVTEALGEKAFNGYEERGNATWIKDLANQPPAEAQ